MPIQCEATPHRDAASLLRREDSTVSASLPGNPDYLSIHKSFLEQEDLDLAFERGRRSTSANIAILGQKTVKPYVSRLTGMKTPTLHFEL